MSEMQDADAHGKPEANPRTHEQRAVDALVALVLRATDALPQQR